MNQEKFKEMFKECAYDLLSVEVQEKYGQHGEKWAEISILVDNEVINTVYLDFPSN